MIRMFDYKCLKCNEWTEAIVERDPIPESIYCDCGGIAQRRWRKAPGLYTNGEYYSEQLRTNFSSKNEFYKHCKQNGLEVMGAGEWDRSKPSSPSTGGDAMKEAQIEEACEKAYQQVIIGGQTPPKQEVISVGDDDLGV